MPQSAWPISFPWATCPHPVAVMSYQVLARKWRPQTFDDIVGQEHVTTTLANALAKGRVAHAYLFCGPRGCGKTTMARLLAKALNCDEGPTPTPCGKCPSCVGIAEGNFLDVLEIDAASHTGVDNIRELRENAQYQPSAGKKRIFIIDEVHMLSKGAFNALLKTLEEPPEHVHFIFATTEPSRIPRTILSRCQRFDFRLFTLDELKSRLRTIVDAEKREVDDEALELLAAMAEGSMRDALSLLDQGLSSVEGKLEKEAVMQLFGLVGPESYLRLIDAIVEKDSRAALDLTEELNHAGFDLVDFARGLVGWFRDLLLMNLDEELAARVEKPEAVKQRMREQARRFPTEDLLYLTQRAADNYGRLERAPHPRWLLDAQVVEYTRLESRVLLSEILGRLAAGGDGGPEGTVPPPVQEQGSLQGGKVSGGSGRGGARAAADVEDGARAEGIAPMSSVPRQRPARPAARVEEGGSMVAGGSGVPVPAADVQTPAGGAQAAAGGGLAQAFRRLAEAAHRENPAVASLLVRAAPRLEGERLSLTFALDDEFSRSQLQDRRILSWLSGLTPSCFGRRLEIEVIADSLQAEEESLRAHVQRDVAPTAGQELERLARENPGLRHLLEKLGGRLVDGS